MKSTALKDPKEQPITNQDDSVTNKDGNTMLEKGAAMKTEENTATKAPSNDNDELYEIADESYTNGQGPTGEIL